MISSKTNEETKIDKIRINEIIGKNLKKTNTLNSWKLAKKTIAVKVNQDNYIEEVRLDIGADGFPRIYTIDFKTVEYRFIELNQVFIPGREKNKYNKLKFDMFTGRPFNLGVPNHRSPSWGYWSIIPYIK